MGPIADHNRQHFSLIPIFMVGLTDGFNPCFMTSALLFFMLLSVAADNKFRIWVGGFLFIFWTLLCQLFLFMGVLDILFLIDFVQAHIRVYYLTMAVILSALAIAHMADWKSYRQNQTTDHFIVSLPVFLATSGIFKKNFLLRWIGNLAFLLGVLVLATILSVMSSVYPPSEELLIIYSAFVSKADPSLSLTSLGVYLGGMIVPLFLVWLLALWMMFRNSPEKRGVIYYKVGMAACCCATALGLGYFFLIQWR